MNWYYARHGADGRLRFRKAFVDPDDALIAVRSSEAGDANLAVKHPHAGGAALQARKDLFAKERLQFARRAGQKHHAAPGVFQPQAGRRSAGILQNFRALGNHRLADIDFRHFAAQRAKSPFDVAENFLVAAEFSAKKFRDGFARQVVLGGAEAARSDNQRHAVERVAKRFAKQIAVVADDSFS